ncbi:MAG TPA: DNA polymerase III subunit beta [Bacteroidetes bacterium]|nr:DNA polymerase III subunit beta [Bacteroidota bacterium]
MRFSVSQSDFIEALNRVTPAVPSKSTLPILSNILMQLEGNRLRMVATDLEISVLTEIEVTGTKDGGLSVPAKKITDIVRELEGLEITCSSGESLHLQIEAGEGSYQVPGIAEQDFPALPEFEGASTVSLPVEKLSSLIQRTSFAVSRDELRPALTGVFFQIRPNEIRCVATDGHRLVRIIDQSFHSEGEPRELIIPAKALDMIRRNLKEDGDVEIAIGTNQILVKLPDATLYSRLIEGRYPHYESVIPQENHNRLVVARDTLIQAVKRAQIFANPISRQIVFTLKPEKLEISAEDVELGSKGRETVAASYTGEEESIGYNAGYVLDLLRQVETDDVQFDLGGPTQAGIVRPTEQKEGEDFLMLIMPVRLA